MSTEPNAAGDQPARKTRKRPPGKRALDLALPHPRLATGARMRTKAGLEFFVDGVQDSMVGDEPTVSWHYLKTGKRMSMRMMRAQRILRGAQVMPPEDREGEADARALAFLKRCGHRMEWRGDRAELVLVLPRGVDLRPTRSPRDTLAAAQVLT